MSAYSIYSLVLCIVVYVMLAGVFSFLVVMLAKSSLKLIRVGAEDDKIIKEFKKRKPKKRTCGVSTIVTSALLCAVFVTIFGFSLYVQANETVYFDNIPTFKVVNSGSMSEKHKKNKYLVDNDLNDQFQTFDVIFTYKLPDEYDLQLYDIVVYEVEKTLLVHRIVYIEEPNEKHPDQRYFLLQGDANERPDRYPVYYNQMKAICRGQRIPFIGSFITFMQSPAGYMCIILLVFGMAMMPVIDGKIEKAKKQRLILLGYIKEEVEIPVATEEEQSQFTFIRGKSKSFIAKIETNDEAKSQYELLRDKLLTIKGVRVLSAFGHETYKCKNHSLMRFAVKGKTLNGFLGLNPDEYTDTKYIYEDVSDKKTYKNYPMRVRITSNRKLKWTEELIDELVKKHGLEILPTPIVYPFAHLIGRKGDTRTFKEKMATASEEVKQRYALIKERLDSIDGVRIINSKKYETFKLSNKSIIKLTIKGKTLNAYLSLAPQDYAGTKYKFSDVGGVKAHANYPMRVKVTSNRQARWVIEMINIILEAK